MPLFCVVPSFFVVIATSPTAVILPVPSASPTITLPLFVTSSFTLPPAVTSSPTRMSPVPAVMVTSLPVVIVLPILILPVPVFATTLPVTSTFRSKFTSPTLSIVTVRSSLARVLPVTSILPLVVCSVRSRPESNIPFSVITIFLSFLSFNASTVISPSCVLVVPFTVMVPSVTFRLMFSFARIAFDVSTSPT